MEENTQEKNLIKKEKVSFFGKIKNFFKNLFGKKQVKVNDEPKVVSEEPNNEFIDYIKMTEDEETKLLELQRKYRKGEIAENDLTDEQIDALCNLYDKQINDLKISIKIKEDKISEYNKRKIENNNA